MISTDASLTVRAPVFASIASIERCLRAKNAWIQRTVARIQTRPRARQKEFISGESFLFLGRAYPLTVTQEADRPLIFQDGFILREQDRGRAQDLFVAWYKNEANQRIGERVQELAHRFGLSFRSIKISSACRRWGSCSANGNLNFSWRLMMTPLSVIDYVATHELAHLIHKNHSKAFWDRVKFMCPDYAEAKSWLRENEGMLQ
jgi:predicted metal-dependent hydrolase